MRLVIRSKTRYGRFSAQSNIGKVIVEIYPDGWLDGMRVLKNGVILLEGVITDFPENDMLSFGKATWEEANTGFYSCETIPYNGKLIWLSVKKPLGKCLKKFE